MTATLLIASEKIAVLPDDTRARTVKLFKNGVNQALRIPKEFELSGTQALIHREGDKLIIEAIRPKFERGSAGALLAALDALSKLGPCDDAFPDVDQGLAPLDDITL